MRLLSGFEMGFVGGGDSAPSCAVVAVKITGSNGNSTTVYSVACSCPEGTTLSTTTSGNTVKSTCKS